MSDTPMPPPPDRMLRDDEAELIHAATRRAASGRNHDQHYVSDLLDRLVSALERVVRERDEALAEVERSRSVDFFRYVARPGDPYV